MIINTDFQSSSYYPVFSNYTSGNGSYFYNSSGFSYEPKEPVKRSWPAEIVHTTWDNVDSIIMKTWKLLQRVAYYFDVSRSFDEDNHTDYRSKFNR